MSPERPARGVLVLVVGPSGAGKDSIMRCARERLGSDAGVTFPRRVVTRPADRSEDNDALTEEAFAEAAGRGEFSLHWRAHGLRYGVPRLVLDGLDRGEIVVVNASRTVVARARHAIGRVRVVLVTAPAAVLEARILARGRDGDAVARLARDAGSLDALKPDVVIDNAGPIGDAVDRLVAVLSGLATREGSVEAGGIPAPPA